MSLGNSTEDSISYKCNSRLVDLLSANSMEVKDLPGSLFVEVDKFYPLINLLCIYHQWDMLTW